MGLVQKNIVANFIGKVWVTIVTYLSIPFYIKLLGIESYGLIGFNVTLNAIISLLDLGFSVTLNKELAKLSSIPGTEQKSRDLVRTLEMVYWPIAIIIGIVVISLSSLIAHNWVHSEHIPSATIQKAVIMMGISIAIQWPFTLYQSAMLGLQRQREMSLISSFIATFQTIGALAALAFVGKTVEVYFGWQIIVSCGITATVAIRLWKSLPQSTRSPEFHFETLKTFWYFSFTVMMSGAISFIVLQVDKVILSKILSLSEFGNYTLMAQLAGLVALVAYPITNSVFPRMVQLFEQNLQKELSRLYHQSCQLISIVTIPLALVFCFYSHEIIELIEKMTGRHLLDNHVDVALSMLAIGSLGNALIHLPYLLQLTANATSLWIKQSAISLVLQIPLLIILGRNYGIVGGAGVYLAICTAYVVFMIPLQHKKVLVGEAILWFRNDFLSPLIFAIGVVLIAKFWNIGTTRPYFTLIYMGTVLTFATIAAAAGAPMIRSEIFNRLNVGRISALFGKSPK